MVIQTTKAIFRGALGLTSRALSLGLDTTKYLMGVMSNDNEGIEIVEKNKPYESKLIVDTRDYNYVVSKLRAFFKSKGFLEAHPQNRLSILAACEDPWTVASFDYAGSVWPLPQTGQMWLEYELLKHPEAPGYFCQSTSYRQEPNPTEGRHDLIFPLFEFEMHGGMDDLIKMEKKL